MISSRPYWGHDQTVLVVISGQLLNRIQIQIFTYYISPNPILTLTMRQQLFPSYKIQLIIKFKQTTHESIFTSSRPVLTCDLYFQLIEISGQTLNEFLITIF